MLLGLQDSENAISRAEKKGQSSVTIQMKEIALHGGLLSADSNNRGLEEQQGSESSVCFFFLSSPHI